MSRKVTARRLFTARGRSKNNKSSEVIDFNSVPLSEINEGNYCAKPTHPRTTKHLHLASGKHSSESDVVSMTKHLIDSGNFVYLNVLGDSYEEVIRPLPIEEVGRKGQHSSDPYSYYGISYDRLTKGEKQTLDYLNNELSLKEAQNKIKDVIQGRFFGSGDTSVKSRKLFYASSLPQDENTSASDLNSSELGQMEAKEGLVGRKSVGLELYHRERRLT
mgnify:CR=1 FL=1